MGRNGWQISVLLPSDYKADGTEMRFFRKKNPDTGNRGMTGRQSVRTPGALRIFGVTVCSVFFNG